MSAMKIALVTCSTREPRINPFITKYVHDIIQEAQWDKEKKKRKKDNNVSISIIDLQNQNLPLYNEPAIPSHLSSTDPTPQYIHEHTRA